MSNSKGGYPERILLQDGTVANVAHTFADIARVYYSGDEGNRELHWYVGIDRRVQSIELEDGGFVRYLERGGKID